MQSNAHFPTRFRQKNSPHTLNWTKMIGAKQLGKCASNSHSSISKMDKAKINKQNKSTATGPLYVHTEFDMI